MAQKSAHWEGNSGLGGVGDCGPYTGSDAQQINKAIALGRTGVVETSHLSVSETSPASKSVTVALGRAIIRGIIYWSDADVTLTISDNASGNPRIDRVVVEVDWTAQTGRLKVVEGTPAASPSAPTLTQTDGTLWQMPLAQIAVANGFTSITNSDITDEREFVDPPRAHAAYMCDETADYTTTSTVFVDIDSTNLKFTLTTNGLDVLIGFYGIVKGFSGGAPITYFDVAVDGNRIGGDDGLVGDHVNNGAYVGQTFTFVYLLSGLSAGSHTFALQWKIDSASSNPATLPAGAGTSDYDVHPQFWVREVS